MSRFTINILGHCSLSTHLPTYLSVVSDSFYINISKKFPSFRERPQAVQQNANNWRI